MYIMTKDINNQKYLEFPDILKNILGKPCCRQRVGEWKSISFGFGEKVFHSKKATDPFYGEWEVGSYSSNWEIYIDNQLFFSSKGKESSNLDLDRKIQEIYFGCIKKVELINDNQDIKLSLSNNINILFYEIKNEIDTEVVHFFTPNNIYIEFHPKNGWVVEN